MADKGYSKPGRNGSINHYDEHGNKTGTSRPGRNGSYNHYDSHGRKTGRSTVNRHGGYDHYDSHGRKTGSTNPSGHGRYRDTDRHGRTTGYSEPGRNDSYHHYDDNGCYIATCVYGSYDCPEVWTLRRFRDDSLAKTKAGRKFIYAYYAISPTIVKWFGDTGWFKAAGHKVLDNFVKKLNENGVQDTPYKDKSWR